MRQLFPKKVSIFLGARGRGLLLSQGWGLFLADDPLGMQRNVETFMESCSSDKISCSAAPTALEGKRALCKCQICVAVWICQPAEENPTFSKVETQSTSWDVLGKRPVNFALTLA